MKKFLLFLTTICVACCFMLPLPATAGNLPDPHTLTFLP